MAQVYKPTSRGRKSKSWWAEYRDPTTGRRVRCSLRTSDRAAAEILLGELQRKQARASAGLVDPHEDHKKRPLTEHVNDWCEALKDRGATATYVALSLKRVMAVICGIAATKWDQLDPNRVLGYLAGRRAEGLSVESSNHYLRRIKQFARWMHRTRRAPDNPLECLGLQNSRTDRRHDRRELSTDEVRRLLDAARSGPVLYGMPGKDRVWLYRLALETGLRANELRLLTWGAFNFKTEPPTVTVEATIAKNRRRDVLPLRMDTAAAIVQWRGSNEVDGSQAVFPYVTPRTADMIRADLRRAKATWIRETRDGKLRRERRDDAFLAIRDGSGRVADFHALRHTFITNLARGGVHPKQAQALARHSTITLTMDRYTHTVLGDLASALDVLPVLGSPEPQRQEQRATGTDGKAADPCMPNACQTGRKNTVMRAVSKLGDKRVARTKNSDFPGKNRQFPSENGMRVLGFEPKTYGLKGRCSETVTHCADNDLRSADAACMPEACQPDDLQALIEAWPRLPEAIRAGIRAMVESCSPERQH